MRRSSVAEAEAPQHGRQQAHRSPGPPSPACTSAFRGSRFAVRVSRLRFRVGALGVLGDLGLVVGGWRRVRVQSLRD
eukprot:3800073-Rhodomonas_salina.3